MQDFTYSYTLEELNLSMMMGTVTEGGIQTRLLLRDNTTGDLEVWLPHEAGLLTWQGRRYGYSYDVTRDPHTVN